VLSSTPSPVEKVDNYPLFQPVRAWKKARRGKRYSASAVARKPFSTQMQSGVLVRDHQRGNPQRLPLPVLLVLLRLPRLAQPSIRAFQ